MCGIVGYYCLNKKSIPEAKKNLNNLLKASMERGDDATGVAFVDKAYKKNVLFCFKKPLSADKFVNDKGYKKLMESSNPQIVIGHTRAKTQGDEKNNVNNHPVVTKSGLAIAHNGIITNDEWIFNKHGMERDGEVDSEAIVKLIEKYKKTKSSTIDAIKYMATEIMGSMAVALIDRKDPKSLFLFVYKNPLILYYQKSTKTIYFASTSPSFFVQLKSLMPHINAIIPIGIHKRFSSAYTHTCFIKIP